LAVVIGFGALLAFLLPLSLYQASLLTVLAALVLVFISFIIMFFARFPPGVSADLVDDEWDDEDDEDEDEVGDGWGVGAPLILHPPLRREEPKTGRNSPCPCGSGKKYKHCCGGGTASPGSQAGAPAL
jgi:hypothetical protein